MQNHNEMPVLYCARWVLPVSSQPIEQGAIAVAGKHIVAVGTRASLTDKFVGARCREFSNAVILPGLVNTHSHLELTVMRGFLEREEGDFLSWLKKLTVARLGRMTSGDRYVSSAMGACEAVAAGITCVADASDSAQETMNALRDVGLRAVVFQEAFGPDPRLAMEQFAKLRDKVAALADLETPLIKAGVSPHAAYTVSAQLLELIAAFAGDKGLPLMMHVAESRAEEQLMRAGTGPFAEAFKKRGIQWDIPECSTIQYLRDRGVMAKQPLLAHCIHLDDDDTAVIANVGASVAHCPKSNAKLGHGRAPLVSLLRKGVTVGLGSDSVASNNTCDILEEGRFALLFSRAADLTDDQGPLTAEHMLRAATLEGARALRFNQRIGELREGLEADFAVVSLSGRHQLPGYDPTNTLFFASSGRDVVLTVIAGVEVFREGHVTTIDEQEVRSRVGKIAERLAS